ncbi:hypothetical protein Btru_029503 [Bulinus truncatus]|nr:hypothetical protein Btru_029503 [Bulinus truncatus]
MTAPSSSTSSTRAMLHTGRSEQSFDHAHPVQQYDPYQRFQSEHHRRFRDAHDETEFSHWFERRPDTETHSDTSVRDTSNPRYHDQNGQIKHRLGPAGLASKAHIRTISSSQKDIGGESPNLGFEWMSSPVLQLSIRRDLHGDGHILPRVSNSTIDRSSALHKTDLPVFNVFSSPGYSSSGAGYAPYLFQNFNSDVTLPTRPAHHGNGSVIPMESNGPRHNFFRHVAHNERSGSPSPSSYNFNNLAGPTKRSSLPKNLEDLHLPSKNQIAEIRRMYDKDDNADDLAIIKKLPIGRGRDSSLKKTTTFNDSRVASKTSRRGEYPTLSFHFYKDFGCNEDYGTLKRRESSGDSPVEPTVKLREDFDESHRRRKRNHIIFLVIVMFIVAIAVMSVVLAATLGSTRGQRCRNKEMTRGEPISQAMTRGEPISQEMTRGEPISQAMTRGEPISQEMIREEPISQEMTRGEPVSHEMTRGEPINQEMIRGEPISQEMIRGEPISQAMTRGEPISEEMTRGEPISQEMIREEPISQEMTRGEPVSQAMTRGEPINQEMIRGEPISQEMIRGEPISREMIRGEPISQAMTRGEPISQEMIREEPISQEMTRGEPVSQEMTRGEPINQEMIRGEPISQEMIRGEPISQEMIRGEPISQEMIRGEPISHLVYRAPTPLILHIVMV